MKPTNLPQAVRYRIYLEDAALLYDNCAKPDFNQIVQFIHRENPNRGWAFDVGCGTGSLIERLVNLGWKCSGCDPAPAMIRIARQKNRGSKIHLSSATNFYTDRHIELITCTSDVVNHLPSHLAVKAFFQRAFDSLRPGGMLVFDSLTPGDINLNWQDYEEVNRFDNAYLIRSGRRNRLGTGVLHYEFFTRLQGDTWRQSIEIHHLRAWSRAWLESALHRIGFIRLRIVDSSTLDRPDSSCVRWLIAAHKPGRKR
jgi:SAM-dependent methyltransferase